MDFIEKAKKIHGVKYDYSLVNYKNAKTKVSIICKKHGVFWQTPNSHLNGCGCRKCFYEKHALKAKYNKNIFIKKAKKVHGDKYDYSLVDYRNIKTKVEIICPLHGKFKQTPNCHLNGNGCPKCSEFSLQSTKSFIAKAIKFHGNKYDYSKTNYKGSKEKILIICPIHGIFWQIASDHLRSGCPKCCIDAFKLGSIEFIRKANKLHGNQYDYSKVDYINNKTKVIVICKTHGEFEQRPDKHLVGDGCPLCPSIVSKPHQEICDYLSSIQLDFTVNNRSAIKPKEVDIYIDSVKLAIELHGVYYHSYNDLTLEKLNKLKHFKKVEDCLNKGIKLIQIFENEWNNKKDLIKSMLCSYFNLNNVIYARNCAIKSLSNEEFNNFVNDNHLKGEYSTKIRLGLYYQNNLVCIMGFNGHKKYDYELTRFCNIKYNTVVGGASKLLNYFQNNYNCNTIFSYADRRISDGNMYKKLGFDFIGITKPNYYYVKNCCSFNRQQFQKHKLHKLLNDFNPTLTEVQNMFNNGFRRIWDAGHLKYLKTIS